MRWTADQARVITSRNKNLLVAAAAGSGKTTVLVERVMRLVEEGANIDEMLIVTFTRASSADMRDKFRKRFREIAQMGVPHAAEQLERLENASISTLHSFCMEVLKNHFEAAGIDPMFRIIDDAEDKQLTERAMDEALENAYQMGGEGIEQLDFARGPMRVRSLVMDMHSFLKERPDPDKWFENACLLMDADGEIWTKALEDALREKLKSAIALNDYAISLAAQPEGPNHYVPALEADREALLEIQNAPYRRMHSLIGAFRQVTPKPGKRVKAEDKTEMQVFLNDTMTAVRKKVKAAVESAKKIVSLDADLSMEDIRASKQSVLTLFDIAKDLSNRLRAYKEKRSALTFSDLEHYTLKALEDDRVSESIRNKYKFVFVDEYQDTSDVQEAIVSKIARENNRFMVGDVKQSIYRFRQAEPKLFLEKYETYKSGGVNELIVLKQNFRSRACVIDFVNHIFARVMHGGASEITYDEDAMLYQGREFEGEDEPVEVHIVDKSASVEDADEDADIHDMNDAEREGYVIAKRIREMRSENPSLKYRDICVLTRVRVNALNHLATVLSENGIPAYADASESYFDALEVMEIMSLLHLLINRRRDIDLISVLRSPIVGLSTMELAKIRARQKSGSFYEAAKQDAENNAVLREFFEKLDAWRALSRSMPIARLIRKIATETGFYAYVGALAGGRQRQANIDMLASRAMHYENTIGGSLPEFLEYAALMRARGDGESAHILSENDDVVRLMTAHKSKGLEFPVVFVSLLGRRFRTQRADDKLTAHRDLGIALMRMDEKLETMRDTIARRAIVETEARQDRAEELRVLYVALTRAQSRLILTGCVRNLETAKIDWKIAQNHPDMYTSALDIVGAAIMNCPGAESLGAKPEKGAPQVQMFIHSPQGASADDSSDDRVQTALSILDKCENGDDFTENMHAAITWQYPNARNIQSPVKLTASGLTREITGAFEIPEIAQRPEFMNEGGLTANERGTAIHTFLRHVDYEKIQGLSGDTLKIALGAQKRYMLEKGLLSPVQGQAVILSSMAQFLDSVIGMRIRNARSVKREWRFNLKMRACDAIENAPSTASVVVQGSIDLCFEENGEWVLLDYKTDKADDKEELKSRYLPQLNLYARALRSITGKPVKEIIICLIRQNDAISIRDEQA